VLAGFVLILATSLILAYSSAARCSAATPGARLDGHERMFASSWDETLAQTCVAGSALGRPSVVAAAYSCFMRYLQRGAATAFAAVLAALLVFWTVMGTKPSGAAVLPILYAGLGGTVIIWLVAEARKVRADRRAGRSGHDEMNRLIRGQYRALKRSRRLSRLTGRSGPEEQSASPPVVASGAAEDHRLRGVIVDHQPIRWDQISERPPAGEEPVPLEPWLEDRIAAHAELVRQRPARGDQWFFAALGQWDVRNTHELLTRVAPDQVDGYYRGGGVPGYRPGHEEAYYERQLAWLQDKLRVLREGVVASAPGQDLVHRGDELLRKVQGERREIERFGARPTTDHMAHQYTDAARRWGADAGFPDEPPPLGGIQMAPAARLRRLEAWLEPHVAAATRLAS
jgi:hypothetical protein